MERDAENHYGSRFYPSLSCDLKEALQTDGFSERNLRYMKSYYLLYNEQIVNLPQVVADSEKTILPQVVAELFMVPWGHHRYIIDKCSSNPDKALFFIHQIVENGWSRNLLLNFLDTDLYERQGKALTNFNRTLPDETSDLARELTFEKMPCASSTAHGMSIIKREQTTPWRMSIGTIA